MLDHLSYSSIVRFIMCPRSWEYHYIHRIARPVSSALFVGSCTHGALEHNYKQKVLTHEDLPVDEVLQWFSDRWDTLDPSVGRPASSTGAESLGIDWKNKDPGLEKDMGVAMVGKYQKTIAKTVQPVVAELGWSRKVDDMKIIGRVDLIDDNAIVTDFKTASRRPRRGSWHTDLQPTFYALGMKSAIVFEYHYMLKLKSPAVEKYRTQRTKSDIEWIVKVLIPPIVKSIRRGIFFPNTQTWKCFSLDTEVLTNNGWKGYNSLSYQDDVLTLNQQTGFLEWQKPYAIFTRKYNQPKRIVSFDGRTISFSVTPDHLMLSRSCGAKQYNHPWQLKTAQSIAGVSSRVFRISGIMERDNYPISNDLLQLTAWALTEGHFRQCSQAIEIAQKTGTRYVNDIQDILNRLSYSYTRRDRKDGCTIFYIKARSGRQLRQIQPDKSAQPWLWKLSKKQFDLWLETFVKGDGSARRGGYIISQRIENTIDLIQGVCISHGYSAIKNPVPKHSSFGGSAYSLSITKNRQEYKMGVGPATKFYHNESASAVWDCAVPNGLIVTRRNGRPLITHNCSPSYCEYYDICRREKQL